MKNQFNLAELNLQQKCMTHTQLCFVYHTLGPSAFTMFEVEPKNNGLNCFI